MSNKVSINQKFKTLLSEHTQKKKFTTQNELNEKKIFVLIKHFLKPEKKFF